jgi:hypothetical protein
MECKGCGKEQDSDFTKLTKGDDIIHANSECTWKPSGQRKPSKATLKLLEESNEEDLLDDYQGN